MRSNIIEIGKLKFILCDAPTEESINNYLTYWKNNQVTDVIRLCEEIYPKTVLENNGINVHALFFDDGTFPTSEIIEQFFAIIRRKFYSSEASDGKIVVHCRSGIGRSSCMIALAAIEFEKKSAVDAINTIKSQTKDYHIIMNDIQQLGLIEYTKNAYACIIL